MSEVPLYASTQGPSNLNHTSLLDDFVNSSQGSGSRVQGPGSRVQGSGFRVQGSWFRVQGSGCMVQGTSGAGLRFGVAQRSLTALRLSANQISKCYQVKVNNRRVSGWSETGTPSRVFAALPGSRDLNLVLTVLCVPDSLSPYVAGPWAQGRGSGSRRGAQDPEFRVQGAGFRGPRAQGRGLGSHRGA